MAANVRAPCSLARSIPVKNQVRMASGGVLSKLKKMVGISKEGPDIVVSSDVNEAHGEFLFDNVEERMNFVALKSFQSISEANWKETPTKDIPSKYKLLKSCHEEFGILPPNNIIKDCCTVNDFVTYYENKRRPGIIPEIWRLQNQKLPRNLSFEAPLPMKRA